MVERNEYVLFLAMLTFSEALGHHLCDGGGPGVLGGLEGALLRTSPGLLR